MEMRSSKIGMVHVLVPPRMKSRIRVGALDTQPIMWLLSVQLDGEVRRLRPCQRFETGWIDPCTQLFGFDVIRNKLDRRELWQTVEDTSLQLIEVCVWVTTGILDRNPSDTSPDIFVS
jgi:hypothetical protein